MSSGGGAADSFAGSALFFYRGPDFLYQGTLGRSFLFLFLLIGEEEIQVFKLVACCDKRFRGLALAHTDDLHARFPEAALRAG